MVCKACGAADLRSLYRLERTPVFLNRFYETPAAARDCPTAEIDLVECGRCGFVFNAAYQDQLMDYADGYVQSQGHSRQFQAYSEGLADEFAAGLRPTDKVVEIGCGREAYFLNMLRARSVDAVGFDPIYEGAGPHVERAYFDAAAAQTLRCDVIIMRLFLYVIERPVAFLTNLRQSLPADTRLYVETPRFEPVAAAGAFWDVSHEICSYFTETFFERLFAGAAAIKRSFASQYMIVQARLGDLASPPERGRATAGAAPSFNANVSAYRDALRAHRQNYVWGAAGKGVAFVTAVDPKAEHIAAAIDINPAKQGRFLPLTGHRCVGPGDLAWDRMPADTCLWIVNENYKDEILGGIPGYRGRVAVLDEMAARAPRQRAEGCRTCCRE